MTTMSSDTLVEHAGDYSVAFSTQIFKQHLTEEVKLDSATVNFYSSFSKIDQTIEQHQQSK